MQIKRNIQITNNTSQELYDLFNVQPSPSGIRVNENTIFSIPHFMNAVRIISNALARTDVASYRIQDDGGREIDDNINAHWLLNWKFNEFQNSFIGKQCMISNMLWSGHSYTYIERNDRGEPTALYNLHPNQVYEVVQYDEKGVANDMWFSYSCNGRYYHFDYNDIIHLQNISSGTGTCGLGIPQILRTCLGKAIALQQFQSYYLDNGTNVNRVVKIPGWLDENQRNELKTQILSYSGIKNSGKTLVLQGGSELQAIPLNNQDFQLIEQAKLTIGEVANIVGIPGSLIGDREAISYGSLEQDMNNFLNLTMDSIFSQVESELTLKLLKPRQQYVSHFIEFDRSSLFASDPSFDARIINKYNNNAITHQEMRKEFKLSTNPTGDLKTPIGQPVNPPAGQAAGQQQQQQEQINMQRNERGADMTKGIIDRLFTRLEKAVITDPNLSKHYDIIRQSLPHNTDKFLNILDEKQDELKAVLPEQRIEVLNSIDKENLCKLIWN